MVSDKNHTLLADVIGLVSHFGGPEVSEEDLEWVADIPSGNKLLEWLAAQTSATHEFQTSASSVDGNHSSHADLYRTVVSSIALYQEELDILDHLHTGGTSSRNHTSELEGPPSGYTPPSTLRSRGEKLEREAESLEARSLRLKRRITFAKSAAKDMKQTINILRKQNETAESTIQQQEEQLSDLSVAADSTAGKCTQQAVALLQSAGHKEEQLTVIKSKIASLDHARHAIAGALARLYTALDVSYSALPYANELEDDAAIVQARLARVDTGSTGASVLTQAAYVEELEKLTHKIEASSPGISLQLEELPQVHGTPLESTKGNSIVPDVKTELERAGHLDRCLLLQTQESSLDIAIREMQQTILPRLQQTYDILCAHCTTVTETEAIVSALIEELEDINDTVESAKRLPDTDDGQDEDPEAIAELAASDLLKSLLQSEGSNRPIVLLSRSDTDAALSFLAEKSAVSRQHEAKWKSDLGTRLAELSSSHDALLSVAYENAPVNTSPPFGPPPAEKAVKESARRKAEELTDASVRLQKASELSSRDKRRLAAWNPEKWAS
ncbi:hypothetical protein BC628DRAFT_1366672 [Trametes gibbosa]|nr:hypothetical protein BC628DRAFT_1366672 [Trametes gibbosa]